MRLLPVPALHHLPDRRRQPLPVPEPARAFQGGGGQEPYHQHRDRHRRHPHEELAESPADGLADQQVLRLAHQRREPSERRPDQRVHDQAAQERTEPVEVAPQVPVGLEAPKALRRREVQTLSASRPGVFVVLWNLAVLGLLAGFVGLILAAAVVLGSQALLTTDVMKDFLRAYPGEYALPSGTEPGFPAWVQWQHYFTAFLMVLIIRTGWQVRTQKRPTMFWTPAWSKNGRGKVSIALWFHLSLDVLWLANGVIFVVLLFVTGRWVRIVPTSWEVIPNAVSATLQYASLNWPTHDGWVNYNSLQQLMYFATVFIAAPLAAISGVRMSSFWPKNAPRLNRLYPLEWARAIHFPVMLFFVGFIIVHVTLVLATGALRNLNHIYGGTDTESWVGFILFVGSMLLIVIVWIAARPLVLAPIARLSGKVTRSQGP